jgi:heptaprenyl diphosphate synthase
VNVGQLLRLPTLEEDLDRVEVELQQAVTSEDPFLTGIAGHLLSAGGKRLRPALSLASAAAGGADATDAVVRGGCSVELVHLGSLYHDDVMDEADTRRTVESVNARWGNLIAILAGDFLLAKASEIAAALGTEVAGLLAATIARLCEGQVLELQHAFQTSRSVEAYLASINGKTASLLASSCRIGALCAHLPRTSVDALTAFGQAFGMVFQIVDDIHDLVLSDDELGKPAGKDLVEGVYTLPVLQALEEPESGEELRVLLGRPIGRPDAEKARAIVRASGGVEAAVVIARGYADRAAAALQGLDSSGSAEAARVTERLAGLGHHLLDRLPA